MSINFTNVYLEDRDRGADDEDEDVRHGEVDEEHVDHSLEAGACGHWQDDLNIGKCQRAWRMTLSKINIDQDTIIRKMRDNPVTWITEKITQ